MGWTKESAAGATNISKPRKIRPAVVCFMAAPMVNSWAVVSHADGRNGKFKPYTKMQLPSLRLAHEGAGPAVSQFGARLRKTCDGAPVARLPRAGGPRAACASGSSGCD